MAASSERDGIRRRRILVAAATVVGAAVTVVGVKTSPFTATPKAERLTVDAATAGVMPRTDGRPARARVHRYKAGDYPSFGKP